MNDKPQPPLCHGSKKRLGSALTKDGPRWILYSGSRLDQNLLCRDQACAWQDRYDSLRAMWYVFDADDPASGPTTFEASGQALKNAAAWRQWEG